MACGVTNAPTAGEHECSHEYDCQVLHCGILRSAGCLVRIRLHGRCLSDSVNTRTFSDAECRLRTVSPMSSSLEPTTLWTPARTVWAAWSVLSNSVRSFVSGSRSALTVLSTLATAWSTWLTTGSTEPTTESACFASAEI